MNLLDLMVKINVDDQASGKISGISGNIKSGLGAAAKAGAVAIGAGVAAAAAGVVAVGKNALDAYASYEQLAGGVDKLFGDASESVKRNAQEAYRTSGLSANEYMQQATSFSAALINSLGGDTQKAAEQADVAMRAMSDNINTFGSNAEDVQNAFQGFAKQNFSMLDNLRLGYGGTKAEMERLIADANEWGAANGAASDLSIESFSDVVTAIDQIQKKQNIAGTTAKEAGRTIEGSLNAAKSAWQNLLTELGKDDGDIGARMDELLTSIFGDGTEANQGVIGNIAPRIATIFEHIVNALPMIIEKVGPYLEQMQAKFQEFVDTHQEEIQALGQTLWNGLVTALGGILQGLLSALGNLISQVITTFPLWAPQVLEAAVMLFVNIVQGIVNVTVDILNAIADLIGQIIQPLIDRGGELLEAAGQFIGNIITGITNTVGGILEAIGSVIGQIIGAVTSRGEELLTAAGEFFGNIVTGITNIAENIRTAVGDAIQGAIDRIGEFAGSMGEAARQFMQGFIDGITGAASDLANSVSDAVGGAVDTVKNFLGIASPSKLMDEMGSFTMEGFSQGIDGMAASANATMHETADYVMSAMSQVLGVSQDQFRQLMDVAMQGMINTVQMAYGPLLDMGNYIISGLVSGIQSNLGAVTDTLFGGVWNAVESVKAFLGIASPSKLFAELGGYTMEGFSNGIEGMADSAEQTMRDTFGNIYAAANGTIDTGQKHGFGSAPQINIVIESFVNNTEQDVRDLSMMLGEYTAMQMKARGFA